MVSKRKVDCHVLKQKFPFRTAYNELSVGDKKYPVFGVPETDHKRIPLTSTSIAQRNKWFQQKAMVVDGQRITKTLPNLNKVEIDNTISPDDVCTGPTLKVIEFNAERGRWWKEFAPILQGYDVIILNEMDIGMARSDQQHTTRNLARYLGMNYAWGLEFVELTVGDANDREGVVKGAQNVHGLHGSAFLAKCNITNPVVFRDLNGQYFSDGKVPNIDPSGLEKRLGGRMGMFGRIQVDGQPVVIGSIHRIGYGQASRIKKYIKSDPAIVAGDQEGDFCGSIGMQNIISDKNHFTWRASCSSTGFKRGDNICSNMKFAQEDVIMPCVNKFGRELLLSDHSFTWAEFDF